MIINTKFKMELKIKPQYLLLSATLDDGAIHSAHIIINYPFPRVFKLAVNDVNLSRIKQLKIALGKEDKIKFLFEFTKTLGDSQAIIFVSHKETA